MGNSIGGTSYETRTLDYYDRLPRSVRKAVAEARFDLALKGYLLMFERGQISAKELVKRIERHDAVLAAEQRRKIWGDDYPVLKGELPTPRKRRAA